MVGDAGRACGIVGFGTDPSVSDRAHAVARDDVGPASEAWARLPFRTDSAPASRLGAVIPGRSVRLPKAALVEVARSKMEAGLPGRCTAPGFLDKGPA